MTAQTQATKTSKKVPVETTPKEVTPAPDMEHFVEDVLDGWRGVMRSMFHMGNGTSAAPDVFVKQAEEWQRQSDKYFADIRQRWTDAARMNPMAMFSPLSAMVSAPQFALREEDGEYIISGAVPGMDAEDLSVEIDGNILRISGTSSVSSENEQNGILFRSAETGSFKQSVCLPHDAATDKVDASANKGVLTVRMPKLAEPASSIKKIKVNR